MKFTEEEVRDRKARGMRQEGFTLLEIILAISLLATVSIFAINILSSQLVMREKVTNKNSQQHAIDMAMQRIFRDLQGAYLTAPDLLNTNSLSKRVLPAFYLSGGNFVFFSQNFKPLIANSNQSNMAFIKYYLAPDMNYHNRQQLMRVVDNDMVENIENKGVGASEVLLTDVKEFSLSFWDGDKYRLDWDSTANDTQNMLPKMVKINLSMWTNNTIENNPTSENILSLQGIVYLLNTQGKKDLLPVATGVYKWQ